MATRVWQLEDEIMLFSLVCDFKPAGQNKLKHMEMIIQRMNEEGKYKEPFTSDQVWEKLGALYDLPKLDALEIIEKTKAVRIRKERMKRMRMRMRTKMKEKKRMKV